MSEYLGKSNVTLPNHALPVGHV